MAGGRAFLAVAGSKLLQSTNDDLTVVTYNILADKYATASQHDGNPSMSWTSRLPRLLSEIESYSADILCLQEVELPFMEDTLGPRLRDLGYEYAFYGRKVTSSVSIPGPEEGVCLGWRKSRLEEVATDTVRFGDYTRYLLGSGTTSSKLDQTSFFKFLREREDGAVLALLHDRKARRHLLAGCTHLYWNPKFPDVKAAQAGLLCAAAVEFLKHTTRSSYSHNDRTPIIIGGDFNSLPEKRISDAFDEVPDGGTLVSAAYTLLTSGSIETSHQDHPSVRRPSEAKMLRNVHLHAAGLQFTSASVAAVGREPPFTNRTPTFTGCLDYIFFTPELFEVSAVLEMPYKWRTRAEGGITDEERMAPDAAAGVRYPCEVFPVLPDEIWPSDHLAVGARLRWRNLGSAV